MSLTMTLHDLFEGAAFNPSNQTGADALVTGVVYDSRIVKGGEVFVAIRGHQTDGAAFVDQARTRGALAIIAATDAPAGFPAPWVKVPDARAALAVLAAEFNRHPADELLVVGVTGTNGKTTTSYLIGSVLDDAGIRTGRVGSVSYRVAPEEDEEDAALTTPEAPDLQALLRQMVECDCRACVMEVSSHALTLKRVDHIGFGAAVFTNLTRDHLDFHGDMERYFGAKRQLFESLPETAPAILNADDPRGALLASTVDRPVTYALEGAADIVPARRELSLKGIVLDVRTPRGPLHLQSRLLGRSNAYNLLAATATCVALDVPFRTIEHGINAVELVPGRMEIVSGETDDITVLVDFAHTDDALRGLLETARPLANGRLITVFGCGGDRDMSKRPLMGAVAARLSDRLVLTSDNPRSEDPEEILRDIERGLSRPVANDAHAKTGSTTPETPWCSIVDRSEAITRAIGEARPGDLVVIAGKGHERYQEIGAHTVPFEDPAVAHAALARRRSSSRVG